MLTFKIHQIISSSVRPTFPPYPLSISDIEAMITCGYRRIRESWFVAASPCEGAPDRVWALAAASCIRPRHWPPSNFGRTGTHTVPAAIRPFRTRHMTLSGIRITWTLLSPSRCICTCGQTIKNKKIVINKQTKWINKWKNDNDRERASEGK